MQLILNLDDRHPVDFKSLDIAYRDFVDGYPTRIYTDGVYHGDFAVLTFEVRDEKPLTIVPIRATL